jgi:hypothetical protein
VVRLDIELKFSPHLLPALWCELEEHVRGELLSANADLRRVTSQHRITLDIRGLPPGSIPDHEVVIC